MVANHVYMDPPEFHVHVSCAYCLCRPPCAFLNASTVQARTIRDHAFQVAVYEYGRRLRLQVPLQIGSSRRSKPLRIPSRSLRRFGQEDSHWASST
jgi:hypothetical protein